MKIPFYNLKASYSGIENEINESIGKVVERGYFIRSEEVEKFERSFADYCAIKHCIGVGNGLDALRLCLEAFGIGQGDEVIVPSHTFIATWLAVSSVGAIPVAVDVCFDSFNLNPELLANAISPRTKAIIPVHLYGHPADIDKIIEITANRDIRIIEDAAQAHGAVYNNKKCGNLADIAAFSFYPTKNLGAFGDGGAITTNDDYIAEKVLMLSNYGSKEKYNFEIKGYNSRLDEIQAAILSVKLKYLDKWNERRRHIADIYFNELGNCKDITLPSVRSNCLPVWHLFVVRLQGRNRVQEQLYIDGIGTMIHYPELPGNQAGYNTLKNAQSIIDTKDLLSLPMGSYLTDEEIMYICNSLKKALNHV